MDLKFRSITQEESRNFYECFEGEKTFLQEVPYANFRNKIGEQTFLFGVFSKNTLVGMALIQKITPRLKTFLHCPHGPLIQSTSEVSQESIWDFFLKQFKDLGKLKKCDFVRIAPLVSAPHILDKLFKTQKFRPAPVHLVNPEKTWILDISLPEDEILKNMRKSTRYEIRRMERLGISVEMGNTNRDLDIFWELHSETVKRQKFVPFPKKNTKIELEVYGQNCQIFSAKVADEFLSSSVILFDKKSAYYHQGASKYSKLPVAHATIWYAIKEAKKRGCSEFNFWGIVGADDKSHPWYGLSRFKKGFGGYEQNYIHCQDFPITSKYWINFLIETYRKWKKGY